MLPRILAQVIFMLMVFCKMSAYAQTPQNTYEIHDILTGQKTTEVWYTQGNTNYPGVYITHRTIQETALLNRIEVSTATSNWWTRKMENRGAMYYLEEFLTTTPYSLSSGESTFGYINIKDKVTHEIIEAWPLFVSLQNNKGVKKMTYIVHLPNNRIMEIDRYYAGRNYFFPFFQEEKTFVPGIDPRNIPEGTDLTPVLERIIVTRRVD